jgi:hypothetical protein
MAIHASMHNDRSYKAHSSMVCDRDAMRPRGNTEQHGRDREPRQTADSRGSSHDGLLSGKPDGALMLAMTVKRWGELQSVP